MKLSEARKIAGSLGFPSKMPGTSYGISARKCLVGSKLVKVPGSVCHGCYALKGHYRHDNVAKAHAKRLKGIYDPRWVEAMVAMLEAWHFANPLKPGVGWHRWHDSGDLQSVEHLSRIAQIAWRLPSIRFWLPTRELGIVKLWLATGEARGKVPPNLTIRISATMVDGPGTGQWPTTSTVHDKVKPDGRTCPAPTQGGKCGDCRACWSRDVANVSYHKH
jgi:hypothetical protein